MADQSKQTLTLLLRVAIGGIFLVAGIGKLFDPLSFLGEISHYEILPDSWLPAVTWFLPSLEIVLGACLLCKSWRREASAILLGLIVIFAFAIILAWVRGLNIECGCFGILEKGGTYPLWIARDLILGVGLIYLVSR
jgi:uncharacterized membrane protein YphA (DoxX/SURF4 family)